MSKRIKLNRLFTHTNKNPFPNRFDNVSILNFKGYYKASELDYGDHGPELHRENIYISVYHFMQYRNIEPSKFDTIAIGGHLCSIIEHGYACKYKVHSYRINKFKFMDLLDYEHIFKQYRL